MTGENDAPAENDTELPISWSCCFEKKVTWNLEYDVADLLQINRKFEVLSRSY